MRCPRTAWLEEASSWEENMKSANALVRAVAVRSLACGVAVILGAGIAAASDNKIALIPGGPHPYFAPWEQAAADAKKAFGIAAVDFKVPTDWKLNLQTELIESLAAQG
jgi:ribose transport system substrate-binding protein